jgi:glycosyltransferase involved in cell wall biosynthesis
MHILHIVDQSVPPLLNSGGSNRLVEWLAVEQAKLGIKVSVLSPEGRSTESFSHIKCDINKVSCKELMSIIPKNITGIEHHSGLDHDLLAEVQANFKSFINVVHAGISSTKNAVFVSKSHAERSSKSVYAYNGIPEEAILFDPVKAEYFLFLAKVKRSKKGVKTAINVAKKTKNKLIVAGGSSFRHVETWFNWHPLVKPVGYINGERKKHILAKAKALLVPIKWDEPFGLTVVEAMMSGVPVIAFNRGAMKELIVHGITGFICDNEAEMIDAMDKVGLLDPYKIRAHAIENFSASSMVNKHLELLKLSSETSW